MPNRLKPRFCSPVVFVACCLVLFACGPSKYAKYAVNYQPPSGAVSAPNYSQLYYWAAHPAKHDPSDSVPTPYREAFPDTSVDVFFVHPTIYLNAKAVDANALKAKPLERLKWNADINDAEMNARVDYTTMLQQASAFNHFSVYAPRYRQAHIKSFSLPTAVNAPFFDTAYADVKAAFLYYLANYNHGKRFVIASHSQGTLHAGRLMRELIDGKPLQQRLVAAYLIGLPVPVSYFSACLPCASATQTGCVISWRTFKKGYLPARIVAEPFKAVVTNPLTWTLDTLAAPKRSHKGAVLYNFNKPLSENVSTQVVGNALWSSKPPLLRQSAFHTQKLPHR